MIPAAPFGLSKPFRISRWLSPVRRLANSIGFDIVRYRSETARERFPDIEEEDLATVEAVRPYTMTSPERLLGLCAAIRYVSKSGIPGAIVECGVWRGGSMMAAARTLMEMSDEARSLYLFDTFEGMTSPTENDVAIDGETAKDLLSKSERSEEDLAWCYAPLQAVREAVLSTGYPEEKVLFVKGAVEETVPASAPEEIALLRLDTDWYESTKHELIHLFPRLITGGVLIVDDYGQWAGARRAVDEYIEQNGVKLLLTRLDYTGRLAVKVSS